MTKELSKELVKGKSGSLVKLGKELSGELRSMGSSSYAAVVVEDDPTLVPPTSTTKHDSKELTVPRRLVPTNVVSCGTSVTKHEKELTVPRRLVSTNVVSCASGTPAAFDEELDDSVSGPREDERSDEQLYI